MRFGDLPTSGGVLSVLSAALESVTGARLSPSADGPPLAEEVTGAGPLQLGAAGYRVPSPDGAVELPGGGQGRVFLTSGDPVRVRWAVEMTGPEPGRVWGRTTVGPHEIACGPDGRVWTGTWWHDDRQTVATSLLAVLFDALAASAAAFGQTPHGGLGREALVRELDAVAPDIRNSPGYVPDTVLGLRGSVLVRAERQPSSGLVMAWAADEADIEATGLVDLPGWGWTRRRRMGPASTDFVVGRGEPHTGPRIEQAPTDLDRKLAGPPLEALDRFLEAWWGLSIGGASSDFDSALDEIRRVNAEHSIWRWDRLAGPGERIDGPGCELVLVVEGQQGYTAWAYDPIDHCGYVYDDMDSSWHSAGHPVSELLLQSVICAVMEAAPANALCELSRSSVQVEGVLDDFSPVRPPIAWLGPSSPSTQLLTNGTVLVAQTGSNVHIAAHDRSAVAHSSLARTGAWVWVG